MPFKKRTKADVKSKQTLSGVSRKANGVKRKVGTKVTFKDGDTVVLLNPSGKGAKYAQELKTGQRLTNVGTPKADADGVFKKLTCCKRAWRSGYLAARKDSAKAYKAKKNNGSKQSSR